MKWRVWLLIFVLAILLISTGIVFVPSGDRYQHLVHYAHISECCRGTTPGEYDEWYDPQAMVLRTNYTLDSAHYYESLQQDHYYWGSDSSTQASVTDSAKWYRKASSNWSGVMTVALLNSSGYYASHAAGPALHAHLNGYPAVRFRITDPYAPGGTYTVWLDPAMRALLQESLLMATGTPPVVWRVTAQRVIPAATLPADFFRTPQVPMWHQVESWLGEHRPFHH